MNAEVSVILPSYNHAPYLKVRLESILNQTFQNFEVIILDDCSTDSSLAVLNNYRNHPRITHFEINDQNSGSPFRQWQKGLSLAKGEFIWIAESDDYCDLNFLESQLSQIEERQLDIVVAETKTVNNQKIKGRTHHPIFKKNNVLNVSLDYFLYCPVLNVSAVVFKKELLNNVKHFNKYLLIGDRVFYFEAFQNKKIALNPNTQSYFRKDGDGLSSLSTKDLNYLILYYKEHYQFAYDAYLEKKINRTLYHLYIIRFFNRVNNRLTKVEKLQFKYLKLRLQYYIDLKK